jgi:ligand-binding sensor domain-containing protein/AraC-like DNA-binding protein
MSKTILSLPGKENFKGLRAAVIFFLFLRTCLIFPLDPGKEISDYIHEAWQTENGLPQSCVQAITQTRDGYLWLGTQEGLVRFDGLRFVIFDKSNTKEIKKNYIQTLLESKEGTLWIGTMGGGLIQLKEGKFTTYTTNEGLSSNNILSTCEDSQGNLWIGTQGGGLNKFKNGKFISYTTKDGLCSNTIMSICQGPGGSVWMSTIPGGLCRLKDKKLTTYTTKEGLSDNVVYAVYKDMKGNLWIGSKEGLNRFHEKKFTNYTTKQGLSCNIIRSIYQDREGILWIGTQGGGINRFKDGRFSAFTTKQGLSHNFVFSIYEDWEGNLWIGTYGGGLNVLKDGKFLTYTTKEGLSHNFIRTIFEDSQGNLWVGTFGGGLNRFNKGKFITYTTKQGLSNNYVLSVYEDRHKNLWIGTHGNGLNRFKNGKFTIYHTVDGLSKDYVLSFCEDRQGNLWIGTYGGGLNRFKNGSFNAYTTKDGLSSNVVRVIHEDRKGNLWIGTYGGGLNCLKNGEVTIYTTGQGLSDNTVYALYEDREENLWIGTDGGGLNRFKNGKFTVYTSKKGLYDDIIFRILEDGKGYFWMTCNKGVFKVKKKELNDFAEGKIKSITCVSYGKGDGMKSPECNGGSQPAGCKTRDGKLWFPTMQGVAVMDSNNNKINTVIPPVIIEKVKVDDQFIDIKENIKIPPGKKRFEFHYTAPSFVAPQKVKFKYKLEGFDEKWVDVGTPVERIAYFTNLSPGKYRFRVIACNNDGTWNQTGASFSFVLKPFFYQTHWFYGLVAIVIIILGLVLHLIRVRKIILRERRKYEKVRLDSESAERYLKKLLDFMESEKPYLDPNITLHKLSKEIIIPGHYLSQVINAKLNKNFYDFINFYRIEEAKRILTNSKNNFTILEVAFEVGFNSKSAFNRAFNKYVKMTPSHFKKSKGILQA